MQVEVNMRERIAQAYRARRGVRLLCVLLLLGAASALFLLADGFPPFAWRLLVQTLPNIPALLAARGSNALLALLGLILLSLTLLFAWGTLIWLTVQMLSYWWYERQELRVFASDAAEAHARASVEPRNVTKSPYTAHSPRLSTHKDGWLDDEGQFYQDTEGEPDWSEEDQPDWEEDEEDEAESELGFYRDEEDEEDDEISWEEQSTRPISAQDQQENAHFAYGQRIVEYSGAGMRSSNAQRSNARRILPFAPALDAAAPYTGAHLPHTATGSEHGTTQDVISSHGFVETPHTSLLKLARANMPQSTTNSLTPESLQSALQLVVSTGLDVGLRRRGKPNEDSLLALQNTRILRGSACPVGLFAIADGMGGHENGQEASRIVIQALSKTVVPAIIHGPTDDNFAELLAEGAHHANLAVYQRNRQAKGDMGTTLAAALVVDTTAYVVNAGDSRVYLYRAASGLSQVTRDHSTVARLVENGLIQPEDIYTHPRRNEIYRSLGHHPSEDLDNFILALQPEDLLLLCSDGLWEMVRDAEIEQVISTTLHQPANIAAALVQAALEGGGNDNISVIVVYVKALNNATYCSVKSSA